MTDLPLREKLEQLIAEWRRRAEDDPMPTDRAIGIEICADELSALLSEDTKCGVCGDPPLGPDRVLVCELPKGHDGYHREGSVTWLGYHVSEDTK